jgi:hypothetical protein
VDRRRFLLTSLTGALVAPLAAEAQEQRKLYRIGVLYVGALAPASLAVDRLFR